jgi:hypothetical protein
LNIIDYSQFSNWLKCPWAWYERYINKRVPKRDYQRDDALALGSLVHDGLENYFRHGRPTISENAIKEQQPTRDCLETAEMLMHAYVQRYPQEQWPLQIMEEPCLFPIGIDGWTGMAKIDKYFQVDELTDLVANEEGHTFALEPGIWVMEHKTKAQSISRANWMMEWEVNRQASFQLLALRERFGDQVRGIVINVIEKPSTYTPKRKCQGCAQTYELATFIPKEDGHACMVCGHVQKLSPYKPTKDRTPSFFRVKVTRTTEQLHAHFREIGEVASRMKNYTAAVQAGFTLGYEVPNTRECVHRQYGPCEYLNNHLYNVSTLDDPNMEPKDTTKYMGLTIV